MEMADWFDGDSPAAKQMRELLRDHSASLGMRSTFGGIDAASDALRRAVEQLQRNDLWRHAIHPSPEWLTKIRAWTERDRWENLQAHPAVVEEARRAAELTQAFRLPNALEAYRSPIDAMTLKLAQAGLAETWRDPTREIWRDTVYLKAFTEASAVGNLSAHSTSVTRALAEASRAMMAEPIGIGSLAEYRGLLDGAGVTLQRWPRMRPMTQTERRRRHRVRQKSHIEPPHVKRAKSLVHCRELALREVLETTMEEAYGTDWPDERLPQCGCKDLLGRWKRRGGSVFDHADYAHYARIVADADHFAEIFHAAFADPDTARELLERAGGLRAASHHARVFTPEDLRDLRVVWRAIDVALIALDVGWVLES